MRLLLFFLFLPLLSAQQTIPEMLYVEWTGTEILYYKAPIDAIPQAAAQAAVPLGVIDADAALEGAALPEAEGDAPAASEPATAPSNVFTNFYTASQHTGEMRAAISLSPGEWVGGNVYSWRETACNMQPVSVNLDQGDYEMAAVTAGIPVISYDEAKSVNLAYRNRSSPVVAGNLTSSSARILTEAIALKLFTVSSPWTLGIVLGGYAARDVVGFLKTLAPADFGVRFPSSSILTEGESITLAPISVPHHCVTKVIFSKTKKSATAKGGVIVP